MPSNIFGMFPQFQSELADAQMQQALAQHLMQRGMSGGNMQPAGGGYQQVPAYGIGNMLSDAAQMMGGALMNRQANQNISDIQQRQMQALTGEGMTQANVDRTMQAQAMANQLSGNQMPQMPQANAAQMPQQMPQRKAPFAIGGEMNPDGRDPAMAVNEYLSNPSAYVQHLEARRQNVIDRQRSAYMTALNPIYAAQQSGNLGLARQQMERAKDNLIRSGDLERANEMQNLIQVHDQDPRAAESMVGIGLASMDKNFATGIKTLGEEARERQISPLKTQKLQEDITGSQFDRQIKQLETQIKQEDSMTRRGELMMKRDELLAKSDQQKREAGSALQSQLEKMDNTLNTIKTIRSHPFITDPGILSGPGTVRGMLERKVPGTQATDFNALIKTLNSQQFMNGINEMRGLGALNQAEGERIENTIRTINPDISAAALKDSLNTIESTLERARQKALSTKELPTTKEGGGFVFNSPTYGVIRENDVNRLMKEHPGSTREQVLQFLNSRR